MYSRTSLVLLNPYDTLAYNNQKSEFFYRCRNCDTNLTSNTPANQYQRQKLIQNTVRVASSLYSMNLASLSSYKKPTPETYNVCWNQQSDRPIPSVQRASVPTGYANSLNNKKYSVTSSKPGSQTPGGTGCDIKHNSYDRYLNRLKGKGPLRRGTIPPNFGSPVIPFNRAYPIYGGKITKTSIVNGCNCPITEKSNDLQIYNNPLFQDINDVTYQFGVGQYVYAIEGTNTYYSKATIISINDGIYTIQFEDGTIEEKTLNEIKIYFPCDCGEIPAESFNSISEFQSSIYGALCLPPNEVIV
jgi:hypothetical protein